MARRIAWIVVATLGVAVAAHAQTAGTARVPQTVQERVDALARQLQPRARAGAVRRYRPVRLTALSPRATARRRHRPPNPSPAADASAAGAGRTIDELQEQVEALDQQVRVLQRQLELEQEKTEQAAKTSVGVTASGTEGFQIESADGAFTLRLQWLPPVGRTLLLEFTSDRRVGRLVPAPPRTSAVGGHALPVRRLQTHARLRQRHDRATGRLCRPEVRSLVQGAIGQVQGPRQPRAAPVGARYSIRRAGAPCFDRAEPRRRCAGLRRPRPRHRQLHRRHHQWRHRRQQRRFRRPGRQGRRGPRLRAAVQERQEGPPRQSRPRHRRNERDSEGHGAHAEPSGLPGRPVSRPSHAIASTSPRPRTRRSPTAITGGFHRRATTTPGRSACSENGSTRRSRCAATSPTAHSARRRGSSPPSYVLTGESSLVSRRVASSRLRHTGALMGGSRARRALSPAAAR